MDGCCGGGRRFQPTTACMQLRVTVPLQPLIKLRVDGAILHDFQVVDKDAELHKEPLVYENIELKQRSYK